MFGFPFSFGFVYLLGCGGDAFLGECGVEENVGEGEVSLSEKGKRSEGKVREGKVIGTGGLSNRAAGEWNVQLKREGGIGLAYCRI